MRSTALSGAVEAQRDHGGAGLERVAVAERSGRSPWRFTLRSAAHLEVLGDDLGPRPRPLANATSTDWAPITT